ncbi:MAG: hypothetical protein FH748_14435 [Balneolaceae bacterium]|nr:hypothetical protein [Balneolaceae bacterium]
MYHKKSHNRQEPDDLELKYPELKNEKILRFSVFIERARSMRGLYIVSGSLQTVLGIAVVVLSLIGSIQPLWLSSVMAAIGSSATMVGGFLLYQTLFDKNPFSSLLHKSIRRVIRSQN